MGSNDGILIRPLAGRESDKSGITQAVLAVSPDKSKPEPRRFT